MDNPIVILLSSLLIGVGSNLLTPYISKWLGNVSKGIKKRNEERKKIFDNTVKFILDNPYEEALLRIRHFPSQITGNIILLISIFMMLSDVPTQATWGFIFSLIAYAVFWVSRSRQKILEEVTKRKKQIHPEIDLD